MEPVATPSLESQCSLIEQKTDYVFKNKALLLCAFTHRSVKQKNVAHYERLEFLGDAVLDLIISEWLMNQHPEMDEGGLSRRRSELVNRETLAALAVFMKLEDHLRLGHGEKQNLGRGLTSILGDVLEALVGAIYMDAGYEVARVWVIQQFERFTQDGAGSISAHDSKSALQEYTQSKGLDLPMYALVEDRGPDHEKIFYVRCELKSGENAVGEGKTKKQAEQNAARTLLEFISAHPSRGTGVNQ